MNELIVHILYDNFSSKQNKIQNLNYPNESISYSKGN